MTDEAIGEAATGPDTRWDDPAAGELNVALVGGPLACRVAHVPDVTVPVVIHDDHGGRHEYRPDGSTAFVDGHDAHLPVFRHFAPAD